MKPSAIRSLLFVPGNKQNMLEKSVGCRPDVLVPDMEDSVPDAEKLAARGAIRNWLPEVSAHSAAVMPRVNSLATGLTEADLEAVIGPHIWGVSIGKIDTPAEISTVSILIARLESAVGLTLGTIKLIPWIETAQAIMRCYSICLASDRIVGVAFGAEDYTNDLGVERLDDESQLIFARSTLTTAARAANITALDTPYFQFRDQPGLETNSIAAKQLGFKGRFAIHPDQIETINRSFSPSALEIETARRVVAAYEEAEARGRASTSLDGRVIDVPVVKRARAVLELAERLSRR
jgi:citrate lyase subunit beta/citryl-CoA lyase